VVTSIAAGTKADIDIAAKAAKKAYKTSWGLKVPGAQRGKLMSKLAVLMGEHIAEFAALDALANGMYSAARVDEATHFLQGKPTTPRTVETTKERLPSWNTMLVGLTKSTGRLSRSVFPLCHISQTHCAVDQRE
jgi:acyl-CoA reductase-like NAD-dependent aldehyde dehydrogenase